MTDVIDVAELVDSVELLRDVTDVAKLVELTGRPTPKVFFSKRRRH